MSKTLRNYIQELIKEVENELEEVNVTGNIDGYQTPYAFSGGKKKNQKKRKKIATQFGMKIVGEGKKIKKPVNRIILKYKHQ